MVEKITDLIPDNQNANKGTQRGLKALDDSLRNYGAGRSVLIDRDGRIIAGNKTVERAVDVGIEDLIIVESDGTKLVAVKRTDLDLEDDGGKARALATYDNRVGQLDLDWDIDALSFVDEDVVGSLWTEKELKEIDWDFGDPPDDPGAQIDRAEELREKWGVETGQLWRLGDHRLICGDCTDRAVVERVMDIDCDTLTDPPYNVGLDYGKETDDKRSPDEYWEWQHIWFELCEAKTDNQIVTPGCVNLERWIAEFTPRHVAVWDKGEGANTYGRVTKYWAWEPIMLHGKYERKRHTDVFRYSALGENPGHPCPKPISLWGDIIENFTGGAIYDPFSGGGVSIIACERLGRKCRAVEISPAYCAVAIQRWVDMTGGEPELLEPVIQVDTGG